MSIAEVTTAVARAYLEKPSLTVGLLPLIAQACDLLTGVQVESNEAIVPGRKKQTRRFIANKTPVQVA